jgi:hypothetical protein
MPAAAAANPLTLISVTPPTLLVLASGKTPAEQNNARGHLFEQFIAQLLENFGYAHPRFENLNVTANGIELDVWTRHRVSSEEAV